MEKAPLIEHLQKRIGQCRDLLAGYPEALLESISEAVIVSCDALRNGAKIILFGNGGSAADAQHIAGELVGRFMKERSALPSIALSTNTSIVTAIGNDYGFERVFARQIEALARSGDVAIGISTSGNSPNIIEALAAAREKGCATIGMTGESGGKMTGLVDVLINVPSTETPRIQENHILIGHLICEMIEQELFP